MEFKSDNWASWENQDLSTTIYKPLDRTLALIPTTATTIMKLQFNFEEKFNSKESQGSCNLDYHEVASLWKLPPLSSSNEGPALQLPLQELVSRVNKDYTYTQKCVLPENSRDVASQILTT